MSARRAQTNSWLAFPRPNTDAPLRLFCFPYAGGGAQIYHAWADGLPETIELCAIRLPGRGARLLETPFTRMTPLIGAMANALFPYFDKPFAFFGHSMGALLSFELTRHLRRSNAVEPSQLFVSGHRSPQLPFRGDAIHALPETEFINTLRSMNGTPEKVLEHAELMQLTLPALRADFAICETYNYLAEPPLTCPISAFGGTQDPKVSRPELEAWREQTTASFSLRMFPGDHFFLHTSQLLLPSLAHELSKLASVTAHS